MPVNFKNTLPEAAGNFAFSAIPNSFLDTIAPTLNPSELRVMLYIYRHTLGFHKLIDSISYDQFLHGMATRNRRLLDKGAGVSRNSLVAALASLESKALIKRQHTEKYGPVIISLQPAALYEPAEDSPVVPAGKEFKPQQAKAVRKEIFGSGKTVNNNSMPASVAETGRNSATGQSNRPDKSGKRQDQILDPEIDISEEEWSDQDQILSKAGVLEVQNLVLTKETQNINQNKPGRMAVTPQALESKLITENVSGISSGEAARLLEQAIANGRDQEYISRLVRHVTDNPAIRVPAAVLTTLIRSNEDRLSMVKRSGKAKLSAQNSLADVSDATSPGLGLSSLGRSQVKKRIDFTKYGHLCAVLSGDRLKDLSGPNSASPSLLADTSAGPGKHVDPRLKYSLQEFDNRLAGYVRHLAVEGNLLEVGFFGAKRIPEPELTGWLPWVNIYYPEVTTVKIIDQGN